MSCPAGQASLLPFRPASYAFRVERDAVADVELRGVGSPVCRGLRPMKELATRSPATRSPLSARTETEPAVRTGRGHDAGLEHDRPSQWKWLSRLR